MTITSTEGRTLNLDRSARADDRPEGGGAVIGGTVAPVRVGSTWEQKTMSPDGKVLTRRVEVIGAPTLSSPVNYRILRNDAHPHRVGKAASIRKSDLRRKYVPVS